MGPIRRGHSHSGRHACPRSSYRCIVQFRLSTRADFVVFGVTERVDSVVYSTEAGAAKPDPKIFQTVCQRLEVAADEVLHIGDNRTADYVGACAAGLHALWLSRNADTHLNVPYEHTINSLDAALMWLEDRK